VISPAPDLGRLVALLADRALEGLSPGRAAELAGLLAEVPDLDDEALDRTAAQLHLTLVSAAAVPLGARLRRAILTDLDRSLTEMPRRPMPSAPPDEPEVDWGRPDPGAELGDDPEPAEAGSARARVLRPRRAQRGAWTHALAAAGWVLALLVSGLWLASHAASSLERRVARAPDRLDLAWVAGSGSTASVAGTLRWSEAEQAGVVELTGLAPNDPAEHRYQLWVVDGAEDGRALPAALFDVASDTEPVRVTLTPALPVGHADRFAVTLEGPRGAPAADRRLRKPLAVAGRE
jgi:hypothetical protein